MFNRLFIALMLFLVTGPSVLSRVPGPDSSMTVSTRDDAAMDAFNMDDLVIPDEMVNQMQHEQPSMCKRIATAYAAAKVVVAQHVAKHKTAYTAAAVVAVAGIIYWLSQK